MLDQGNRQHRFVRWSLDGRQRSRAFRTKAEADRYRSGLLVAQQSGERTRASAVEAITRLLPLLVPLPAPAPPAGLRAHLRAWLPPDGFEADAEAAAWLAHWSLQLGQLSRPVLATGSSRPSSPASTISITWAATTDLVILAIASWSSTSRSRTPSALPSFRSRCPRWS